MKRILSAFAVLVSVVALAPARAAAAPAGFADVLVADGFSSATALEILPGGRIAVLGQDGEVTIVQPGSNATNVAIDVPVCSDTNETGLLSMAIDPAFATNGYVYLYGTVPDDDGSCSSSARGQRLSRYTMSGNVIDPQSELVLIDNVPATNGNHNGGTVEFGRDGYLYLSIGNAGTPPRGAPDAAQDMSLLAGKIVRITRTGAPAPGNPFLSAANHGPCARAGLTAPPMRVCDEIYALGLRNPFRMAFDPNASGVRFFINDVGETSYEEIDEGLIGANYGWPEREGACAKGGGDCNAVTPYTDPITDYGRTFGRYVVGGAFVPDGWWPAAYEGGYVFADGGSSLMWVMSADGSVEYEEPFTTGVGVATDMAFGVRNGERALFYVRTDGQLRKIVGPAAATSDPDGPAYVVEPSDPPVAPPVETTPGSHAYVPYDEAARVYDTRNGIGAAPGKVPAGATRTVDLGVPGDASAALVNITLPNDVGPEDPDTFAGYLTAWETGTPMPATSNANVSARSVAANAAVLAVDGAGRTNVTVSTELHVIIDVLGYYTEVDGPVAAGRFEALTPARIIDTRAPAGGGNEYTRVDDGNTSVIRFAARGLRGVPASADTVGITVTALSPPSDASGYVTAYAGGAARPATSTVNHSGDLDVRANLALVPIGADGTVELYLYQTADVVVDVAGWLTDASDRVGRGGLLRLTEPTRIADSRSSLGFAPLAPGGMATLEPTGVPASASGLVQNVTFVSRDPGWICATPNPWSGGDVSIQNASAAGQDRPALTFTELGAAGPPRLRYCTQQSADIIVDVFGWYE